MLTVADILPRASFAGRPRHRAGGLPSDSEGNGVLLISCLPDDAAALCDLVASHKIAIDVEQLRILHTPPGRRPGPGPRPGPGAP